MGSIKDYMSDDHRRCDDQFAAAEKAVSDGDWEAGAEQFDGFRKTVERHFDMEESVLFPEFEHTTGMTEGPTAVMRSEHEEMRRLFEQMAMALEARYEEEYLDAAETLLILMQQHNMKEEQMLYEMADRQFGDRTPEILARMRDLTS